MQASDDTNYFAETCGRRLSADERTKLQAGLLKAYRWQYIFSGAQHPHFVKVLTSLITERQLERIQAALASLA
jgi:hypothetical protein